MSVREALKLVEVLWLAESAEETVFLHLDGVSMLKLVASSFFTFPGKCSVESPYDSVNPPCTHVHVLITGHFIFSNTQHYAVYDPGIGVTCPLPASRRYALGTMYYLNTMDLV